MILNAKCQWACMSTWFALISSVKYWLRMTFAVHCLSGSILSFYVDIQDANVVIAREYYWQCSSIGNAVEKHIFACTQGSWNMEKVFFISRLTPITKTMIYRTGVSHYIQEWRSRFSVEGFKVWSSWSFWKSKGSRFSSFRVFEFLSFEFLDFWVFEFSSFRASEFSSFRIFGFSSFWHFEFRVFWVSECSSFYFLVFEFSKLNTNKTFIIYWT